MLTTSVHHRIHTDTVLLIAFDLIGLKTLGDSIDTALNLLGHNLAPLWLQN